MLSPAWWWNLKASNTHHADSLLIGARTWQISRNNLGAVVASIINEWRQGWIMTISSTRQSRYFNASTARQCSALLLGDPAKSPQAFALLMKQKH
jgi:hypothetical protein